MSSQPRLARLATQALARARRVAPSPSPEDEARAIQAIADALDRRATAARRRRRAIGGGLAAAACIAAAIGALAIRAPRPQPVTIAEVAPQGAAQGPAPAQLVTAQGHALAGSVVLLRQGREVSLDEGSAVTRGDRIVAPADGRASVTLSTGTHLVAESGADFGVAELGVEQRFMLRAGAVHADVAKLAAGQRFLIGTPDAEVEVRGTSFRVAIVAPSPTCGGGTSTRVTVTEGTVVVRAGAAEQRVTAGGAWPVDCAPRGEAAAPSAPVSPSAPSAPAPPRSTSTAIPAMPATSTSSEIAEQNRLFAEASGARRRGATTEAIAAYDAFLARYPSSQLAESAMVERMRLLGATRSAASASAAREYLARYPGGFARQEATSLAAGRP